MVRRLFAAITSVVVLSLSIEAQVPAVLHYQGRILAGGSVFDGGGRFKFALLDSTGTRFFWRNAPDANGDGEPDVAVTLTVTRGLYSVLLGDTTLTNMAALPSGMPAADLRLRVWFDDGSHGMQRLAPDQRLASVAYALVAGTVPDGAITASKLASNAVAAGAISGVLSPSQIPVLDAGVLGTGVLSADRLPANIARKDRDVDPVAGQAAHLATQVSQLSTTLQQVHAQLLGLEARFIDQLSHPVVAPGVVRASTDPADAELLASGHGLLATLPAAAWRTGVGDGAPSPRSAHGMAWLPMLGHAAVWGGEVGPGVYSALGASYLPASDTWISWTSAGAPSPRRGHSMVADGGDGLLIWGGFSAEGYLNSGARYDVGDGTWSSLSTSLAPVGREGHVGQLTGPFLTVWGGRNSSGFLGDGALYRVSTGAWSPLDTVGAPAARSGASAVWTGQRLVIWGGATGAGPDGSGAQLVFQDGIGGLVPSRWAAVTATSAPGPRTGHTAVWTGRLMLVWGGRSGAGPLGDGAAYDPYADQWTPISSVGAPVARSGHVAVWSGSEMLVFGGDGGGGTLRDGAAYDPVLKRWRPLTSDGSPVSRTASTSIWTGTEWLVFGGQSEGVLAASLQRLVPQPAWHLYRKLQP